MIGTRLITSLMYRLKRRKFTVAQNLYQTLLRSSLVFESRERTCCKMEARKLQIRKNSVSSFSQLFWTCQSDYVFADNFLNRNQLCSSCLLRIQNKGHGVLFIDVDNLRMNSAQISEAIDKLSSFDLMVGFNESKNFSLNELFSRLPRIGNQNYIMNLQESAEKFFPLPLGLRDGKEVQPSNYPMSEHYYNSLGKFHNSKDTEVLAAFSVWTNPYRDLLMKAYQSDPSVKSINLELGSEKFKTSIGKMHPVDLYTYMKKSKYVLCPVGAGFDTHRFYETILCGSIPIVERTGTAFDQIYEWFPCKVVDSLMNLPILELQMGYTFEQRRVDQFLSDYPTLISSVETLKKFTIFNN